jgi:hypothetical protein
MEQLGSGPKRCINELRHFHLRRLIGLIFIRHKDMFESIALFGQVF